MPCNCFFCSQDKPHPEREFHFDFNEVSARLLVAESLDPKDQVRQEACATCGHVRDKVVKS